MGAFAVGQQVEAHWPTDHTLLTPFTVVKRTAKFVTLRRDDTGETVRVGVTVSYGEEWCLPFGRYSMAPVVRADREVER